METKFILINSLNESLILSLYDYNDHRKNALLSSTSFELAKLQEDATWEGIEAPLLKDGQERGILRYNVTYYPVIKPEEGHEELDTSRFQPQLHKTFVFIVLSRCWHSALDGPPS